MLVKAPPEPRGIVHFLGGAFAGAAPALAYSLLIDRIVLSGYTVVATPYAVTFDHGTCARRVHARFAGTLRELRSDSGSRWAAPEGARVHGVGHSNGALLHLLVGALCDPPNASNALISYNNRSVKEAVPVPLGAAQPVLERLRARGRLEAQAAQAATQALGGLRAAADLARAPPGWPEALGQLAPALEQLGSVLDEVGDGSFDFTPTPEEAHALISSSYKVPATLLVQFDDDTIDQSREMAAALRGRNARGISSLRLPGTHVTPVAPSLGWVPQGPLTVSAALALAAQGVAQAGAHRLADQVNLWLERNS